MSESEIQVALTSKEIANTQKVLGDPTVFPQIFKTWLGKFVETDTTLALSQIQGWTDFNNDLTTDQATQDASIATNTASIATNTTNIATNSSAIAALQALGLEFDVNTATNSLSHDTSWTTGTHTVGLNNIPAGSYVVIFGSTVQVTAPATGLGTAELGVGFNGANPTSVRTTAFFVNNSNAADIVAGGSLVSGFQITVSNNDDLDVYFQTLSGGATGASFAKTWIVGYRYA